MRGGPAGRSVERGKEVLYERGGTQPGVLVQESPQLVTFVNETANELLLGSELDSAR